MEVNKIYHTDALSGLQALASQLVNCIITSPPYFGLRNYQTQPIAWPEVEYSILGFPVKVAAMSCELGQEPDHFAFIGHLVLIFREAHRVLKDDGTLWVNIGDSYNSASSNQNGRKDAGSTINSARYSHPDCRSSPRLVPDIPRR